MKKVYTIVYLLFLFYTIYPQNVNGNLFYVHYENNQINIFRGNSDGTNLLQLTSNAGNNWLPRVNNNQSKVAFISDRTGKYQIYTMNIDGSNTVQLTTSGVSGGQNNNSWGGVCWTPDGKLLYINGNKIYKMNADGTNASVIATAPSNYWSDLRCSSTGKIAAQTQGSWAYDMAIYIMNSDGSGMGVLVPDDPGGQSLGNFSADGSKLYYSYDITGHEESSGLNYDSQIYSINIDGTGKTKISTTKPSGYNDANPCVVGTKIYFVEYQAINGITGCEIWQMNLDGSQRAKVITGAFNYQPDLVVSGIPLIASIPNQLYSGQEFTANIQVGNSNNPITDLSVISFELNYPNSLIDYIIDGPVGELFNGNASKVVLNDAGKVSVSIYKTPIGTSVSGAGSIISLKFKVHADAQENQVVNLFFNNYQANKPSGELISLNPQPISAPIKKGIAIWPGDTNNDKVVNILDVNPIIINFNATGPARDPDQQGNNWSEKSGYPWNPIAGTYADCNGNGTVEITDLNPVIVNFGKTHTLLNSPISIKESSNLVNNPLLTGNCPIYPKKGGDEFWIDISLGSTDKPFNNLKIISFELLYNQALPIKYTGDSKLGNILAGANPLVQPTPGKLSASAYSTSSVFSGSGIIYSFKFKVDDSVKTSRKVPFTFGLVQANDGNGVLIPIDTSYFRVTEVTNIASEIPNDFSLSQNYPNPFNPSTNINWSIPKNGQVKLRIYDVLGNEVATLVDEFRQTGTYNTIFNARHLSSGVYYYQLIADSFTETRKMILIK